MGVIGHRSCPAYGPENTVRAVETAAPYVDAIEVDVRRCGSGELVAFHDATLDRLTDADGRVDETDWEVLRSLGVDGTDEPIPRFEELLASVPADVAVNVELKETGLADEVAAACADAPNDCFVSSFLPAALDETRAASAGELPTALLFGLDAEGFGDEEWAAAFERAAARDCEYLHPRHSILDADRVAAAHDRGFAVNAWTVPDAPTVVSLREMGVDGVIVDDWEIAER